MGQRADGVKGKQRAQILIQELDIRKPDDIDVEAIATRCGCFSTYRDITGSEGFLLRAGQVGLIVVGNDALQTKRWRFVIAHELGHYLLHNFIDQFDSSTSPELHASYRASAQEEEANAFAAELLMPSVLFRPNAEPARPTMAAIRDLSEKFNTTLSSTALRFVEFCSHPCAIVFSKSDAIVWWRTGPGFPYELKKGRVIAPSECLNQNISDAEAPRRTPISAWADSDRPGNWINAQSVQLGVYGKLTLLWEP